MGRIAVPDGLRRAGFLVVTLAERYGMPGDERIADETWLRDAGKLDDIVLMKDGRIRRRRPEIEAVRRFKVRCFCLSNGNLSSQEMVDRFTINRHRIEEASSEPGPFIYAVRAADIQKLQFH